MCEFASWMIAWRLSICGLLGRFTYLVCGLVVAMLVAAVCLGSALLRTGLGLRGAGCTAAGTWRAGGRTAFWSLWVGRTIRSRFVVFALSLGRLRLRCEGTRVCRRGR